MSFWKSFYESTATHEMMPGKISTRTVEDSVDMNQFSRYLLTWMVGALVSLFPTFMQILVNSNRGDIFETFFSNKDIFLVATTLTISVMFEIIYDSRKSITKNFVISIDIILIVFSIHIFTLLQQKIYYDYFYIFGMVLFSLCIIDSVFGYVMVSIKGGEKKDE